MTCFLSVWSVWRAGLHRPLLAPRMRRGRDDTPGVKVTARGKSARNSARRAGLQAEVADGPLGQAELLHLARCGQRQLARADREHVSRHLEPGQFAPAVRD